MNKVRIAIGALSLTAAGLAAILNSEGYTDDAVIPTKGDRPTVGFGSTFREDGTPVQMGDTITPHRAVARTLAHIQKDERGLKRCVTAPLAHGEYDVLVDFSYQYGVAATCASTMVREANAGNYEASCAGYLLYKKSQGRDCSDPKHWGPRGCKGVWLRSQERYRACMEAE